MKDDFFEWDEIKNRANVLKHGVSFEEAKYVFDDPFGFIIKERMFLNEIRYNLIGCTKKGQLLNVVWTPRGEKIRIISAWKGTKQDIRRYQNER